MMANFVVQGRTLALSEITTSSSYGKYQIMEIEVDQYSSTLEQEFGNVFNET